MTTWTRDASGNPVHFCNVSGGKDSTATALYLLDAGIECEYIFADTGHEHPTTLEYLDYLDTIFPTKIIRVRADFTARMETRRNNLQKVWSESGVPQSRIDRAMEIITPTGIPMLDLSLLKGRFPSARARFCTQELKVMPIIEQIYMPAIRAGAFPVSWQGVRAEESAARSKLPMCSIDDPGVIIARPLLHWKAKTVFNFVEAHGVQHNPLYSEGMGRVGCMPCIMANKRDLRTISTRFPEHFERLAEWELLVADASKRGLATFFAADKTPGAGDTRSHAMAVKEWSMTTRGGRMRDILGDLEEVKSCDSIYGLCE